MNNSKRPDKASDLTAFIKEIIEYWKAIAERSFKKAHQFSDPREFEQNWPRALDNFFLVATIRTANALRPLSEGRDN